MALLVDTSPPTLTPLFQFDGPWPCFPYPWSLISSWRCWPLGESGQAPTHLPIVDLTDDLCRSLARNLTFSRARYRSVILLIVESGVFMSISKLIEFTLFQLAPPDGLHGLNALYIQMDSMPQVMVQYLCSSNQVQIVLIINYRVSVLHLSCWPYRKAWLLQQAITVPPGEPQERHELPLRLVTSFRCNFWWLQRQRQKLNQILAMLTLWGGPFSTRKRSEKWGLPKCGCIFILMAPGLFAHPP